MTTNTSLDKLVKLTGDLPSMPHVANKVMEVVADPNATATTLQGVIQDDQALAGRILKIANSALYARSRQVTTLTDAIVMLGFNTIRSLAVTNATRNLYLKKGKIPGLKDRLLWEHSVGAAVAGRIIAQHIDQRFAEEAFLGGLLHDIGKLVILQQLPDEFNSIVEAVYNDGREFVDAEEQVLGFNHAKVGAMIVRKWNLSKRFEGVILDHHSIDSLDDPVDIWLRYIDLSNKICKKLGFGFVHREEMDLVEDSATVALGIPESILESIVSTSKRLVTDEMDIFS